MAKGKSILEDEKNKAASENEEKHSTLEIKEEKDKDKTSEGKLEDIIKISKKRKYNTIYGG